MAHVEIRQPLLARNAPPVLSVAARPVVVRGSNQSAGGLIDRFRQRVRALKHEPVMEPAVYLDDHAVVPGPRGVDAGPNPAPVGVPELGARNDLPAAVRE